MNVQLNDSGVPILRQKTFGQKVKTFLLWTILVIMTLAAALLVYLCLAGASEMAALTTLKKVSDHPYYTMEYENFDYSDLLTEECDSNDAVIKFYKSKFFKSLSGAMPGGYKNDYVTRGSYAFASRTSTTSQVRGRVYNSYDSPILMVIAKPENGYKSWNIVDMADVGLLSGQSIDQWYSNAFQTVAATYCVSEGINSEFFGVSLISCPVAECDETSKVNVTPFLACRLLLDRVATVDSAIDLLNDYDIDFSCGSYHFFISDKNGECAIIEYIDGKMSVTNRKDDMFHLVCTNKMEDKTVRSAEKDYSNRYKELSVYTDYERTLSSQYTHGFGVDRTYAFLMLNDSAQDEAATEEDHFGTNMYGTQYAVIYQMDKMQMRVVIENDRETQMFDYDLS